MISLKKFALIVLAAGAVLLPEPGHRLAADSKTEMSPFRRVEDLTRTISELHHRIAVLEKTANTGPNQAGQKVVAPFEVVDANGKSLLLVTSEKIQAVGSTRVTGSLQVASPSGTFDRGPGGQGPAPRGPV